MRLVLLVMLAAAASCELSGAVAPGQDNDESDNSSAQCPGASPAPYCGEPGCTCCGSCDPTHELCFAAGWELQLGYGQCRARPVAGTMTATVDGAAFVANEVAAVTSTGYVQVNGRMNIASSATDVTTYQITIQAPARLGTFDCSDAQLAIFAYTISDRSTGDLVDAYNQQTLMPRPACTFSITSIGEVGARIEGTFAVMLAEPTTSTAHAIVDGAFSVERVVFP